MSVDLEILKYRHKFLRSLREYFYNQDFLEVETPYLIAANTPDPHIDPVFARVLHPKKQELQLHTSPEIWLKKALALGASRIFEIAHVFRDDPPGPAHAKEFTMLEWYRTHADLNDMIADCQKIFKLAQDDHRQNLPLVFEQRTVSELFKHYAQIDLDHVLERIALGNYLELNNKLAERGDLLYENSDFVDAFFLVMIKYVEPQLPADTPIIVSRWPVQLAALADACEDNDRFCDRFEIYYQGLEIANAYQECCDPKVLLERFDRENTQRKALKKPVFSIDNEFLNSLKDQPKTAGIALGIDRLIMATLKKRHMRDLILGYFE
jgi:lysyl-tRNA synthetase class 2